MLVPQQTSFSFDESLIKSLHNATETCLQQLPGQDSKAVLDIVNGAAAILGWLVLLAVSESWLQDDPALRDRLLSAGQVDIPVASEAGIEVVIARLLLRPAKLQLVGDNKVLGTTQISWGELELGPPRCDELIEIKKLIWKRVLKGDAPQTFKKVDEDDLKATLKYLREKGENYYIIILPEHRDRIPNTEHLLTHLRRDLEYLGTFHIGSEAADRILVMPEGNLRAQIRQFLLMLRKFL